MAKSSCTGDSSRWLLEPPLDQQFESATDRVVTRTAPGGFVTLVLLFCGGCSPGAMRNGAPCQVDDDCRGGICLPAQGSAEEERSNAINGDFGFPRGMC